MKIGIDLDDTLVDFTGSLIKYHNRNYGTNTKREDVKSYDAAAALGISPNLLKSRVEDFYETTEFRNMPPVKGAVKFVPKIGEENELFIITGRPKYSEKTTRLWIEEHFPKNFEEIRFSDKRDISLHALNKGEACKDLKLKVFIEDGLHYAKQCAKKGIRVLLLDTPWNQCSKRMEDKYGYIRIFSWKEVPSAIKAYRSF